jgi:hypothetical protein
MAQMESILFRLVPMYPEELDLDLEHDFCDLLDAFTAAGTAMSSIPSALARKKATATKKPKQVGAAAEVVIGSIRCPSGTHGEVHASKKLGEAGVARCRRKP